MSLEIHVFDCKTKLDITSALGLETTSSYAEAFRPSDTDEWINTQSFSATKQQPCGTFGYIVWEGFAQYYAAYNDPFDYSINNNLWITEPWGNHPWGSIPGVNSQLSFTNLAPNAVGLRRLLRARWNCCKRNGYTEYSYLAISTTRQRGKEL
jgi:hypothetical protein